MSHSTVGSHQDTIYFFTARVYRKTSKSAVVMLLDYNPSVDNIPLILNEEDSPNYLTCYKNVMSRSLLEGDLVKVLIDTKHTVKDLTGKDVHLAKVIEVLERADSIKANAEMLVYEKQLGDKLSHLWKDYVKNKNEIIKIYQFRPYIKPNKVLANLIKYPVVIRMLKENEDLTLIQKCFTELDYLPEWFDEEHLGEAMVLFK